MLFKSNGNKVVAFSPRFTIGKTLSPMAALIKPANLNIENDINTGGLASNVNRVKDAASYFHQFATDGMPDTQNRSHNCRPAIMYKIQLRSLLFAKLKDRLINSDTVNGRRLIC